MRKRLLSLFSEVIQNEPSVLVLEDLDHAMPHVSDAQEQVQEDQLAKSEVRGGRNVRSTLPLLFVFYPPCIITIVKSEGLAHTSICLDLPFEVGEVGQVCSSSPPTITEQVHPKSVA